MTLTQIIANAAADSEFGEAMSSNDIWYGTSSDDRLTDVISTVASEVLNRASTSHNHDEDYAAIEHTHSTSEITGLSSIVDAYSKTESDARYSAINHTHSGYAEANHTHTALSIGAAEVDHTHTAYASATHTHSDYAAANHTHSNYMTENAALSAFAGINHTHTLGSLGAASSTHTHTPASIGAAASSHTHDDYLPLDGGTVTGETNFSGGLVRVGGAQTLFHSGSQMILSSNSLPTRICGSAISATQTISVDSDERLKENIELVDIDDCAEFISNLKVSTFNYIGNDKPCIGVIAQDVNELNMGDLFVSQNEEGYFSIKAADLVFPLVATVQKLSQKVDELTKKVEELST